ncbi:hypothetical protein [Candidatus Regiella insecticola]|uniref:hypothetical protein n=1 Tax=Candidatus Regiella insecticola TaxID=138073 RepID=UPI00030F0343|nr:hypothetical protein [Candidatus Regiella insecticola]
MNLLKLVVIGVYGIIGLIGWYKYYEELAARPMGAATVNKFSPEMTVTYIPAMVRYHSIGKLQVLRSILLTDNLEDKEQVKTRITNILKHCTSVHIRDFNLLDTPIKNIGNWYQDNFDFDNFLAAVFDEVFNSKLSVEEKIRNIFDVMETYQNATTQKLLIEMNKLTGNQY